VQEHRCRKASSTVGPAENFAEELPALRDHAKSQRSFAATRTHFRIKFATELFLQRRSIFVFDL
jgi:hypothetical protein